MSFFEDLELIIIPVVNPDGYEYTWNKNRLWRKNRSNINNKVDGVDLNRNWPFHWGRDGSSSNPESETYGGPYAGSELEVQALIKYFNSYRKNIVGAIDFHSYSQLILRPYGYTKIQTKNEKKLSNLSLRMSDAIGKHRSKKYKSIKAADLYPASGISSDWFYQKGNNMYAYTFELSPGSSSFGGFILPPDQIIPIGEEIYSAMEIFLDHAINDPIKI